jgi:hypothetical protein
MNRHLSNEGQEWKAGPVKGKVQVGEGGQMKRVKESEYG